MRIDRLEQMHESVPAASSVTDSQAGLMKPPRPAAADPVIQTTRFPHRKELFTWQS